MTRKATKQTRLDLWLDDADLALLDAMTDAWQVSRQRVIESALTYAVARGAQPADGTAAYIRRQRVPLNLDGLALRQINALPADSDVSTGIRLALRHFYAAQEVCHTA